MRFVIKLTDDIRVSRIATEPDPYKAIFYEKIQAFLKIDVREPENIQA